PTDFLNNPCPAGTTAPECQGYTCNALTGDARTTCMANFYTDHVYKPHLVELRDYARSKAGNLKFQPIYYGNETGTARDDAKNALNSMAEAANGEEDPSLL